MAINDRSPLRATAGPDPSRTFEPSSGDVSFSARCRQSTTNLGKILQAATPGWIARLARAKSCFGLSDHEISGGRGCQEILLAYAKAVTQQRIVGRLLHPETRSQVRLEDGRTVITEIGDLARRVVAEEIALGCLLPLPSFLEMVGDSSCGDFRTFTPTDRAAMPFRMRGSAIG